MEHEIIEALGSIVDYNGHGPKITELSSYIDSYIKHNKRSAPYPDFLPKDSNHFLRTIWSIMVLIWGGYGMSPRYGWVTDLHKAFEFLNELGRQDRECEEIEGSLK